MFAYHDHVENAAASLFRQLAKERRLAELDATTFSGRTAHYLGEGNGRTRREFIGQLAQENGYSIAWERVNETDMLQASVESFHGNTSKLSALIEHHLHLFERSDSL